MKRRLGILALAALSVGCTPQIPGGTSGSPNTPQPGGNIGSSTNLGATSMVARLGLSDARSLFVTGGATMGASYRTLTAGDAQLFKQDASGKIAPVQAFGSDGSGIAAPTPNYVTQVGDYVFVSFTGATRGCYLSRRSDGKVAQLETQAILALSSSGEFPVRADGSGNIFYVFQGALIRVAHPNLGQTIQSLMPHFSIQAEDSSDSLVKTQLTNPSLENVSSNFVVDNDGNVLAQVGTNLRLYKAAGGVNNLGAGRSFWLGRDGAFYQVAMTTGQNGMQTTGIQKVIPSNAGSPTIVPIVNQISNTGVQITSEPYVMPDRTAFLGSLNSVISFKDGATSYSHLTNLFDARVAGYSDNKLYLIGRPDNDSLEQVYATYDFSDDPKFNPGIPSEVTSYSATDSTPITTTLYTYSDGSTGSVPVKYTRDQRLTVDPNFQILKMAVSPDDTVTVSALRFSDNTYIVGNLAPNGQVTVLSTTIPQVQQIIPLQ